MPLYEYKCSGCGQVFEIIQRFSDSPLTKHDACGGDVERLISTSALQFKGSGWYVNDYARGNKNGGASKGETKTETKTETKSDSGSKTSSTPADKK